MLRVNIIGAGKVGRTLMSLVGTVRDAKLTDVLSGHLQSAEAAVAVSGRGRAVSSMAEMGPAELWVLSVPDDRIVSVARALAEAQGGQKLPSDAVAPVAMHCSGFLSSDVLAPLRDLGWSVASCHPVLSFADPEIAARQFPGTCCAIEGDAPATALVAGLITALQGLPFAVDPERKALYHAAAVFSNNFTTVLQAIAREAWTDAGVSAEIAARLGNSLLAGTSESVSRLGPAAALTGPAARGDLEVLRRQEAAVAAWNPEAAALYATLSRMARRLKKTATALPPSAQVARDGPSSED
ncbi:MAG: DUF2520 domain-containing protein [Rhodobacteraceae bacterium]|nr:DUF2520 domain-containing protein [Paracoccaceae bacterium]